MTSRMTLSSKSLFRNPQCPPSNPLIVGGNNFQDQGDIKDFSEGDAFQGVGQVSPGPSVVSIGNTGVVKRSRQVSPSAQSRDHIMQPPAQ